MTRTARPDEEQAATIVAKAIGAAAAYWQGAGDNHDYDLRLDDDAFDALEVTRLTDERWIRLAVELERAADQFADAPELANSWAIWLSDEAKKAKKSVRSLTKSLRPLLLAVEADGLVRFDRDRDYDWMNKCFPTESLNRLFALLPVEDGWVYSNKRGAVVVHPPGAAAAVGGNLVNEAINLFCSDPDRDKDRSKLRRAAGARRRHLFVWIDEFGSSFAVGASLFQPPPELIPQLPEPITDCWAAARRGDQLVAWHASLDTPWNIVA